MKPNYIKKWTVSARRLYLQVIALIDFIHKHPQVIVMAKGSTASRTRLYQMGIAEFWEDIQEIFEVKAYYKDRWESFERGKNYDAFFIFKK
ncbi:hypothetical protein K2F45_16085 [Sphingobacterium siyangense]|uniref:DUF6934 family protein n=1 Tax=Sphingobacterium TaxID=28453 RepID=UPI000B493AB0|nr:MULTISPECIES: hypothetical protein [Sphingobacterium]UQA73344.1 hypothetical protein K2F45_16085 [Sphingobacterium siyangense]